jgi:glucose/arabinose dehydrogenase
MTSRTRHMLLIWAALTLAACGGGPTLPSAAGYGTNPALPAPRENLIPTVNIASVEGWTSGRTPIAARGFQVAAFARGLTHPRWLYVLPNGDVLVAETNGPAEPPTGVKDWVMKVLQKSAGAGTPSPDRITLLRDENGDGVAETRSVFLQGLHSPFGMALVGQDLYVADTDAILRFPYRDGETAIAAKGTKLADLPGGPIDHHWTKNIIASRDGTKLYVTIGSNSNIAENGMANESGRAAIWEVDRATGKARIFASGLRNPNGMGWEPATGALWTAVNERDELGNDLVPDYMTAVRDGAFYGWPYSYFGQHVDDRVAPQRPEMVAKAIAPDYALGAHTGSLGLAFYTSSAFPAHYRGGVFIGQHGSWNRSVPSGYKVVFVPFQNGKPNGMAEDVLTGFLDSQGRAQGRPVGVAVDKSGALLVADDVGDTIWRMTRSGPDVANLQNAAP